MGLLPRGTAALENPQIRDLRSGTKSEARLFPSNLESRLDLGIRADQYPCLNSPSSILTICALKVDKTERENYLWA